MKVRDDFLILDNTEIECNSALNKLKYLMAELGYPLVSAKTSSAVTQDLTFLGVRLNSNTMTAQLPLDKLAKYSKEVQGMINKDVQRLLKRSTEDNWPTAILNMSNIHWKTLLEAPHRPN